MLSISFQDNSCLKLFLNQNIYNKVKAFGSLNGNQVVSQVSSISLYSCAVFHSHGLDGAINAI